MEKLKENEKWRAERARQIIESLGLEWEDLKGKKILEIGAGEAMIAETAKGKDIDVVSLDKNPWRWEENTKTRLARISYIQGAAGKISFKDEVFDLVISYAAPPIISQSKEEVGRVIREMLRVTRAGGEVRFGPGPLLGKIFQERELLAPEEEQSFTREERIERIKQKSLEFLESVVPHVVWIDKKNERHYSKGFYIVKKADK